MKGFIVCARHARSRSPVLWISLHTASPLVRVQALVRGWLLRRRLALAGPGALCRAGLANEEDVFTCESKDRHHPLAYIEFDDGGQRWWFDAASLSMWATRCLEPLNPYTNTPLSHDVLRRLRAMERLSDFPCVPQTVSELTSRRWTQLVQIFRDNGFLDVHPHQVAELEAADYRTMFVFLERDLQIVLSEHDCHREALLRLARQGRERLAVPLHRLHSASLLLRMLALPRTPYTLVYSILSALYRC